VYIVSFLRLELIKNVLKLVLMCTMIVIDFTTFEFEIKTNTH